MCSNEDRRCNASPIATLPEVNAPFSEFQCNRQSSVAFPQRVLEVSKRINRARSKTIYGYQSFQYRAICFHYTKELQVQLFISLSRSIRIPMKFLRRSSKLSRNYQIKKKSEKLKKKKKFNPITEKSWKLSFLLSSLRVLSIIARSFLEISELFGEKNQKSVNYIEILQMEVLPSQSSALFIALASVPLPSVAAFRECNAESLAGLFLAASSSPRVQRRSIAPVRSKSCQALYVVSRRVVRKAQLFTSLSSRSRQSYLSSNFRIRRRPESPARSPPASSPTARRFYFRKLQELVFRVIG